MEDDEKQEKYCFVFEYAQGACIGIGADTLQEARAIFTKMIEDHNLKAGGVGRRGKPIKKLNIDPYLIEPKVY